MEEIARPHNLPRGIVPVLQTPFSQSGEIDWASLAALINHAIQSGAAGFLAPAVASEVESLSPTERARLLPFVLEAINHRVPLIAGASHPDPAQANRFALQSQSADAVLISVPDALYQDPQAILPYFQSATENLTRPLIVQDLQFNGPGLSLPQIESLQANLPTLAGLKIETVPAGPKYSAVRTAFGPNFYIAGGWAIQQMIEALDRGVDAMIPEASMVPVYNAIFRLHQSGRRTEAQTLFRRLLPVLAFTNQEIALSIAFFKLLLQRKGVFTSTLMRRPAPAWDQHTTQTAAALIDLYLELESELPSTP